MGAGGQVGLRITIKIIILHALVAKLAISRLLFDSFAVRQHFFFVLCLLRLAIPHPIVIMNILNYDVTLTVMQVGANAIALGR